MGVKNSLKNVRPNLQDSTRPSEMLVKQIFRATRKRRADISRIRSNFCSFQPVNKILVFATLAGRGALFADHFTNKYDLGGRYLP